MGLNPGQYTGDGKAGSNAGGSVQRHQGLAPADEVPNLGAETPVVDPNPLHQGKDSPRFGTGVVLVVPPHHFKQQWEEIQPFLGHREPPSPAILFVVAPPKDAIGDELVQPGGEDVGGNALFRFEELAIRLFSPEDHVAEDEEGPAIPHHFEGKIDGTVAVAPNVVFEAVNRAKEWTGTDVEFTVTPTAQGTNLKFVHRGLRPQLECYSACHDAWTAYVAGSLKDLVLTGRGKPAPVDDVVARVRPKQEGINLQFVPQSPEDVWRAVDPDAEFVFRFRELHRSTQKVVRRTEPQTLAWKMIDSHLSFAPNPAEWTGTEIVFELEPFEGGTAVHFNHRGLVPELSCYQDR